MATFRSDPGDYRMAVVADLPFAHNPFKCHFRDNHRKKKIQIEKRDRLNKLMLRPLPNKNSDVRAGQWVWEHHQSQASECCDKHVLSDEDFIQAAAVAAHLFQTVKLWEKSSIYDTYIKPRTPTGNEPLDPATALTWSLISDPITWDGHNSQVGNGQHRICGARVAGCTHLLIAGH